MKRHEQIDDEPMDELVPQLIVELVPQLIVESLKRLSKRLWDHIGVQLWDRSRSLLSNQLKNQLYEFRGMDYEET